MYIRWDYFFMMKSIISGPICERITSDRTMILKRFMIMFYDKTEAKSDFSTVGYFPTDIKRKKYV